MFGHPRGWDHPSSIISIKNFEEETLANIDILIRYKAQEE
jgi:hypothetical protein